MLLLTLTLTPTSPLTLLRHLLSSHPNLLRLRGFFQAFFMQRKHIDDIDVREIGHDEGCRFREGRLVRIRIRRGIVRFRGVQRAAEYNILHFFLLLLIHNDETELRSGIHEYLLLCICLCLPYRRHHRGGIRALRLKRRCMPMCRRWELEFERRMGRERWFRLENNSSTKKKA